MPLTTGHLTTGSLSDKARATTAKGGHRAVAALKQRQVANKKRAADARARDKADLASRREIRNATDFDIFNKRESEVDAVAKGDEAAQAEARPADEQQPKTDGALVGKVIGAIDRGKLAESLAAFGAVVDGFTAAQSGFSGVSGSLAAIGSPERFHFPYDDVPAALQSALDAMDALSEALNSIGSAIVDFEDAGVAFTVFRKGKRDR